MTHNDLKALFLGYCRKDSGTPDKQLIGMENGNFVFIPDEDNPEGGFRPLPVDGDSGVFSVLENLVELTKDTADPLEKIYEKDMLLALTSPVSYTHLRAHETLMNLVCRLLLEKNTYRFL